MALIEIQVRQEGDSVMIVTDKGIERGIIHTRAISSLDQVIYSIKIEGRKHYRKKCEDEVFNSLDQLIQYYGHRFKQDEKRS